MYSFYGGKEGRTYHLVAHYDSIYQMVVQCFQKGGSYTDANYHEYVIIDTPNKSSRENGIIYRRGLNYQQEFALTGQKTITRNDTIEVTLYGEPNVVYKTINGIAPPASGSLSKKVKVPKYYDYSYKLSKDSHDNIIIDLHEISLKKDSEGKEIFENEFKNFCMAPGGGAEYVGHIVGPMGQSPQVTLENWKKFHETYLNSSNGIKGELKADRTNGKIDNTHYTDEIKYGYCNFIDETTGENLGVYLSFDFPVTIFEYTAESVSPYGPIIKEVDSLPVEGREDVYYKYNGNYYLWDKTKQIVDIASSTPETTVYKTVPGFVETSPWKTIHEEDSTDWQYEGLIREKAESAEHPFYKSYDIKVPRGVHGEDICEMSTHIVDMSGNLLNPNDDILDTVARDENGNILQEFSDGKATNNFSVYYKTKDYNNKEKGEVSDENHIGWFRVVDRITDNSNKHPEWPEIKRDVDYVLNDRVAANVYNLKEGLGLLCILSGHTSSDPIDCRDYTIGYEFKDGNVKWRVIEIDTTPANLLTVHYTYGKDNNITIRMLDQLSLSDDGRIYAKYTDLNSFVYLGEAKSIKEVFFDNQDGVQSFIIKYNVKKRGADGQVIIDNNRANIQKDSGGILAKRDSLGYVIGYPTTDSEGYLLEQIPQHVKFVSSIDTDPKTQIITLTYNDGTTQNFGPYYAITGIQLNENLEMEFTWNYKDLDGVTNHKSTLIDILKNKPHKFRTVNKIWTVNDGDIDEDQFIKANYYVGKYDSQGNLTQNGIGDEEKVSEYPINRVEAMCLNGDNLCVLYTSKDKRNKLLSDPSKYYMLPYTNPKNRRTGNYPWHNLGPILAGNHIIGSFDSLLDLKTAYPYGFGKNASGNEDSTTKNRAGWLANVRYIDGGGHEVVETYAYDYAGAAKGKYTAKPGDAWQKINYLTDISVDPNTSMIVCEPDMDYTKAAARPVNNNTNKANKLNINGYWFVNIPETEEYI